MFKRIFSKPLECDTKKMEPIITEMEKIGKAHNKTIAQVAINWLIATPDINVFPIPGTRNLKQAIDNIGAVDWTMSIEERDKISKVKVN